MKAVDRRGFVLLLPLGAAFGAEPAEQTIEGKLVLTPEDKPALETAARGRVLLDGDPPTLAVVRDARLRGLTFQALGQYAAPGLFRIGPIYRPCMFILRDGKKLYITYWCDVCSIRTYAPGICWCCQQETALDLRESSDRDGS